MNVIRAGPSCEIYSVDSTDASMTERVERATDRWTTLPRRGFSLFSRAALRPVRQDRRPGGLMVVHVRMYGGTEVRRHGGTEALYSVGVFRMFFFSSSGPTVVALYSTAVHVRSTVQYIRSSPTSAVHANPSDGARRDVSFVIIWSLTEFGCWRRCGDTVDLQSCNRLFSVRWRWFARVQNEREWGKVVVCRCARVSQYSAVRPLGPTILVQVLAPSGLGKLRRSDQSVHPSISSLWAEKAGIALGIVASVTELVVVPLVPTFSIFSIFFHLFPSGFPFSIFPCFSRFFHVPLSATPPSWWRWWNSPLPREPFIPCGSLSPVAPCLVMTYRSGTPTKPASPSRRTLTRFPEIQ